MHRHLLALATFALSIPLLAQNTSIRLTNGVNGGAEIPYAPQMIPQSGITLEAWITYDDATIIAGWSHPTIVRQNINGGQESFFLRVQAENTRRTRLSFALRTSTGLTWVNWDFTPGQLMPWTHVAATYDGALQRLFVNGVEVASVPGNGQPLMDQGSLLHIGKGDPGSTFSAYEVWNGDIDELRLWPFARTAAEIQSTMNLELSSVPGLVSTWNLNTSTGFQDSSSTLHGASIGAVAFTNAAPALQSIPFPGARTAGASTAGCLGAIEATIGSLPQRGNANFAFVAHRLPTGASAAIVFGTRNLSAPFRILGVDLWVDPASVGFFVSPASLDPLGSARFSLPIPGVGRPGFAFAGQFVFLDPCGPQGITASTGLACSTIL